jgi:hypothetical protein
LGRRSRRSAACPSRGRRPPTTARPRATRPRRRRWSSARLTRGSSSTRLPVRWRACAVATPASPCRAPTPSVSPPTAASSRRHGIRPRRCRRKRPRSRLAGTTTRSRTSSRSARCRPPRCARCSRRDSRICIILFVPFRSCWLTSSCLVVFGRVQFQFLKQQRERQLAAWRAQQHGAGAKSAGFGGNASFGLSLEAWPPLQKPQQHHAPAGGMRAVFLTTPGAQRERNGTGVFLPRPVVALAEPKKKSGASVAPTACLVVSCPLDLLLSSFGAFFTVLQGVRLFLSPLVFV